jgi:hypothetical protein
VLPVPDSCGFCEGAGPGQGARSARGAAPEVPLTRLPGSRIIAAGPGGGSVAGTEFSCAVRGVAASLGRGGLRAALAAGKWQACGAASLTLARGAGLARIPVT